MTGLDLVAKPDCDDGWHKIAYELEAALDFADFPKLARTVLRYTFSQIYGQGVRPTFARLSCSEIASRISRPRQHVHRARAELVASGVLIPIPGREDCFRFVKDYEKWFAVARVRGSFVATETLLLTPDEVADCMDAPGFSRLFDQRKGTTSQSSHQQPSDITGDVKATSPVMSGDPGATSNLMSGRHHAGCQSDITGDVSHMLTEYTTSTEGECANPLHDSVLRESVTKGTGIALNSNAERRGEEGLLDAREGAVAPLNLAELLAWLPCITDDRDKRERLAHLVPLWFNWIARRCPQHSTSVCEWIQDALIASSEAKDIVTYARKFLRDWVALGGRPDFELAPKPKAVPDETDTPAPPNGVPGSSRPSYGDRVRLDRERLLASFDDYTDQEPDR